MLEELKNNFKAWWRNPIVWLQRGGGEGLCKRNYCWNKGGYCSIFQHEPYPVAMPVSSHNRKMIQNKAPNYVRTISRNSQLVFGLCPVQSPDLSPTELSWEQLDCMVCPDISTCGWHFMHSWTNWTILCSQLEGETENSISACWMAHGGARQHWLMAQMIAFCSSFW